MIWTLVRRGILGHVKSRRFISLFPVNRTKPRSIVRIGNTATCSIRCFSSSKLKSVEVRTAIEQNGSQFSITKDNGKVMNFPSVWLRVNCHCSECRQHQVGAKKIDPAEVNIYTTIQSVELDDTGTILKIKWIDHDGEIPVDFLTNNYVLERENRERHSWIRKQVLPSMSYQEITQSKAGVLKWLRYINDAGVCLLNGVPTEHHMCKKVTEYMGPILHTMYGEVFDVRNEEKPINVAYTTDELPLHMDLLFYESPPGIQFLHCMRFDECVEGGDSVLLDLFHVAEIFRNEHPDDFKILTKVPAVFERIHYTRDRPVHMAYKRPHIILNEKDEIITVNWGAHQEGPLPLSFGQENVMAYYKAHQKFAIAIKYSNDKMNVRLRPGDTLVFNNRRTLHGRSKFKLNGGVRSFEGNYVLFDDFVSQLKIMSMELEDTTPFFNTGYQV